MNLSYWEYKTWLSDIDFTIVGSGIVGLSCALTLRDRFPKARILVLEKGILPQGASTKNAGFACFGSISEILSDLEVHGRDEVYQLVEKRWLGIQSLRKNLGDQALDFQPNGGHELFMDAKEDLYQNCLAGLDDVNRLLKPIFKTDAFVSQSNRFGFKGIKEQYISNILEAQIDTGKMMEALIQKVQSKNIKILNAIEVQDFQENPSSVDVKTNAFEFKTNKLLIATNGVYSTVGRGIRPTRKGTGSYNQTHSGPSNKGNLSFG